MEKTNQLPFVSGYYQKTANDSDNEYVNYEPREDNCKAACTLGKKLKVPVYVFLKEALDQKIWTEVL